MSETIQSTCSCCPIHRRPDGADPLGDGLRAAVLAGDFVLASGRRSDVYFDKWRALCDPGLLTQAALRLAARIDAPDRLAGPQLGGTVLATAISLARHVPQLALRADVKPYGTGNLIEGPYALGDRVELVEDVLTSGETALRSIRALRAHGLEVTRCSALVDREEGAREALAAVGVRTEAAYTLAELRRAAT